MTVDARTEPSAPRPLLRSPWALALLGTWLLLAGLLAHRLAGQALDDLFITYRYAQNFAAGHGLVFNPGERVFGTTAPGWALVLGGVSRLAGVPVHLLGSTATGLALVALAALLLADARRSGSPRPVPGGNQGEGTPGLSVASRAPEAALAGTLVVTSTYFWVHNGLEVYPSLALLVAAAQVASGANRDGGGRKPQRGAEVLAGLLGGTAVWLRPESALAAGLLALLRWWRRPGRGLQRLPWAYASTVAAIVAGGLAAATLWFGTPLPQTLAAKRLQAAWSSEAWAAGLDFWPAAWRWLLLTYTGGPGTGAIFVLGGAAGLVVMLRRGGDGLRLLALYALTLFAAYPLLEVPFYTWYPIPVLIALTYGLVFAAGAALRTLLPIAAGLGSLGSRPPATRAVAAAAALTLIALAGWPMVEAARRTWGGYRDFQGMPRYLAYRAAGEWLHDHAAPGATVAYIEVGTIAYFSDLPVRDLLGLVSPGVLPFVERRDLAGAFAAAPPATYVLDSERVHGLMAPIVSRPAFAESYAPAARFPVPSTTETIVIYQRRGMDR